jgi:hypothetical protein
VSSDNFNTPPEVITAIKDYAVKHIINLDPCSNGGSMVGAETADETNGLNIDWQPFHTIFINPPYSKITPWAKKCWETFTEGLNFERNHEIFLLVPANSDTKWFQTYCVRPKANAVLFFNKRLRFWLNGKPAKDTARFPSVLVYFGNYGERFKNYFNQFGAIWA